MSNKKLYEYCKSGDLEAVKNEIKLGADEYNNGLFVACSYGNLQLVEYMLSLGANNYNYGLHYLCNSRYYNVKIAILMIQRGATNLYLYYRYNNPSKVITLLENNLNPVYLKNMYMYNNLINDLDNFKQETKKSLTVYLLDPIYLL
jgi:hypothetical protein